jgi:hypothetical protein
MRVGFRIRCNAGGECTNTVPLVVSAILEQPDMTHICFNTIHAKHRANSTQKHSPPPDSLQKSTHKNQYRGRKEGGGRREERGERERGGKKGGREEEKGWGNEKEETTGTLEQWIKTDEREMGM